eukprot:6734538-Lingulodinium_polyedra.AAC.1
MSGWLDMLADAGRVLPEPRDALAHRRRPCEPRRAGLGPVRSHPVGPGAGDARHSAGGPRGRAG